MRFLVLEAWQGSGIERHDNYIPISMGTAFAGELC